MTTPRVLLHPDIPYTATRRLACSLLDEALGLLAGPTPAPVRPALPPTLPGRGARVGHPVVWEAPRIVAAVQAFVARHGRPPTPAEWRHPGASALPARATVVAEYGSMDAAYVACGLVPPASRPGQGGVRYD